MITIKAEGNYDNAISYFKRLIQLSKRRSLNAYGRKGVEALKSATPVATGETADAWTYTIDYSKNGVTITWNNNHVENGFNVAIGLQYGHGTNNGGYVKGIDYINPAIRPIFEEMAGDLWKEVTAK